MNKKRFFGGQIWELWYPQRYHILIIFGFCVLLVLFDCSAQHSVKTEAQQTAVKFTKPDVPSVFTTAEQRAEYLVSEYLDDWDDWDD